MQTIYIFGHKNPDTDSVASAISLSYLKNALGFKTSPKVLGTLNKETRFVLNYFNIKEPEYLNNVNIQIRNTHYKKNYYKSSDISIEEALEYLLSHEKQLSKYNPENGWGHYENFVYCLPQYIRACYKWPNAILEVDR